MFDICDTEQFDENFSPVLLEIDPPIDVNIPCLINGEFKVKKM